MSAQPTGVLLTGATGALGVVLARALRQAGAALVLVARRPQPLNRLARSLDARAIPWDLTRDPGLLAELVGPVDWVVHAAGQRPDPAPEADSAQLRRLLELHLLGPLTLSAACVGLNPQARSVGFGPPPGGTGAWAASHAACAAMAPAWPGSPLLRLIRVPAEGPAQDLALVGAVLRAVRPAAQSA